MIKTEELLAAIERTKDQTGVNLINPVEFLPIPNKTVVLITFENEIMRGYLTFHSGEMCWFANVLSEKEQPALAVGRYLPFRSIAYWLG